LKGAILTMKANAATIEVTLSGLCVHASKEGNVPPELARAAATATAHAFPQFQGRALQSGERRRVEAYFNAVVRRRVIRGRASRHAASRAVLSAVVADLKSAGCEARRIAEELERGWRGQVPDDVLDEWTLRLVS
jgi:hypothetical protein